MTGNSVKEINFVLHHRKKNRQIPAKLFFAFGLGYILMLVVVITFG